MNPRLQYALSQAHRDELRRVAAERRLSGAATGLRTRAAVRIVRPGTLRFRKLGLARLA